MIIADEHHVYRSRAKAFSAAIRELGPRALVGLTATPDAADLDKVIYRYPLAAAIADQLVKVPVIVYRQDGIKDVSTQLADAARLRAAKEPTWHAWATEHGRAPVSPVLFVVCQTIADAELVATELGAHLPEEGAVLLITSQSSDAALAAVEAADSPVRAIVSVDKLKEGWDVRNIGVIVGLRALASQTLTEQVLGRGLRLPYGARTGMAAIDQVDLVAHDSYKQLLRSKDALLEKLVAAEQGDPDLPAPRFTTEELDGTMRITTTAPGESIPGPDDALGGLSEADLLLVTSLDEAEQRIAAESAAVGRHMPLRADAPRIVFPRRDRVLVPVPFSLASVSLADAELAGAQHSNNETVTMQREAIRAERDLEGDVTVSTQKVESVEATQSLVSASQVRADLLGRVMNLGLIPAQLTERLHAEEVVDAFLHGAGVTPAAETDWTARRAAAAEHAIAALVREAWQRNDRQPSYRWNPVSLPPARPLPPHVEPWYSLFVVRQWYGEWHRAVEYASSFDSESGEFALAQLLDRSESVRWWLRLYTIDEAWVNLTPAGRYFPDFIVVDANGIQWLVEAKSDAAMLAPDVLAKKAAAEQWVEAVNESRSFGTWRYLLVSESDIGKASNWDSLVG